jgi:RNA polymerase sigma factor (sigma-70 family)
MSTCNDTALLEAWNAGDARAGDELLRRSTPLVRRFFASKVDPADVDDLSQRTMLACVTHRERIRGDGFRVYLLGIARNQLLMHYRRIHRVEADPSRVTLLTLLDERSVRSVVVARDEQSRLLVALWRLPLDLQLTLELYYWEGLSLAELADVTAVPVGTVKSRLARAKTALRKHLEEDRMSPSTRRLSATDFEAWVRAMRDHGSR